MKLGKKTSENLLLDGDFEVEKPRIPYHVGKWGMWSSSGYKSNFCALDKKVFMTGTSSLRLTNVLNQRASAGQRFKGMKPNTRYRVSFFLKTRNLTGKTGAGAYLSMGPTQMPLPNIRITGTTDWYKRTFEIKTPAHVTPETQCVLGLWIWNAAGTAWYDDVSITENLQLDSSAEVLISNITNQTKFQ